jgi:hypothetical protein
MGRLLAWMRWRILLKVSNLELRSDWLILAACFVVEKNTD